MLYISVKQLINFGTSCSNFLNQDQVYRVDIYKSCQVYAQNLVLSFKNYITEPPNISYIAIEHKAKLSFHQKDEPSKRASHANQRKLTCTTQLEVVMSISSPR